MKPCSIALFFTVLAAAGAPGSTPVISQAPPRSSVRDAWLIADSNVVADGERVWLSFVRGEAFPIAAVATPPGEVSEVQDRSGGATRSLPGLAAEDLGGIYSHSAFGSRNPRHGLHFIGLHCQ